MYPTDPSISSYGSNPSTPVNSPPPLSSQPNPLSIIGNGGQPSWQPLNTIPIAAANQSNLNSMQNSIYQAELVSRGLHMVSGAGFLWINFFFLEFFLFPLICFSKISFSFGLMHGFCFIFFYLFFLYRPILLKSNRWMMLLVCFEIIQIRTRLVFGSTRFSKLKISCFPMFLVNFLEIC